MRAAMWPPIHIALHLYPSRRTGQSSIQSNSPKCLIIVVMTTSSSSITVVIIATTSITVVIATVATITMHALAGKRGWGA